MYSLKSFRVFMGVIIRKDYLRVTIHWDSNLLKSTSKFGYAVFITKVPSLKVYLRISARQNIAVWDCVARWLHLDTSSSPCPLLFRISVGSLTPCHSCWLPVTTKKKPVLNRDEGNRNQTINICNKTACRCQRLLLWSVQEISGIRHKFSARN